MRVLVIDDSSDSGTPIASALLSAGIVPEVVKFGQDGIELNKVYKFDLIILDLMLPDISGFEVLLRLRAARITTPVLIVSAISATDQKVQGFYCGADDYLIKPFNRAELIARVRSIVRRSKENTDSSYKFDKITINFNTRAVEVDGKRVHLTNKEYGILELLVLRRGTVLTKDMFLTHLYNTDVPDVKVVDVFVCKLRKKLEDASGGTNYIDTVWGRGYILKEYKDDENVIEDIN